MDYREKRRKWRENWKAYTKAHPRPPKPLPTFDPTIPPFTGGGPIGPKGGLSGRRTKNGLSEPMLRALLHETMEIPKEEAKIIVKAIIQALINAVRRQETIKIRGIGAIKPFWWHPRTVVNPARKTITPSPGRWTTTFVPDKSILFFINNPDFDPTTYRFVDRRTREHRNTKNVNILPTEDQEG